MKLKLYLFILVILKLLVINADLSYAVILDSYLDDFDDYQDNVGIDGVGDWEVIQGEGANAVTQSTVTFSGSGKALKLASNLTPVNIVRDASYGSLTPTWVHSSVRPAYSGQNPVVPASGIAAVCFSYYGKILASDGLSWVDTGKSYTIGEWYDLILKLNFKTHCYDLYVNSKLSPDVQFIPIKTALKFIDTSINALSRIKLYGSYFSRLSDEVYIDEVSVTYIDKLEIISNPQELMSDQASWPIIVQLQNSLSEAQTAVSDIVLELKSTSSKGRFSLNRELWKDIGQLVIPKDSQQAVFYYKDTIAGRPVITVSEYPDTGINDASQQESIVSKVSCFSVEVISPRVAGEDFSIEIRAKDEQGNVNESYSGSVNIEADYISPSNGSCKISPKKASGFAKGVLKVNTNYADCGLITIIVSDSEDSSKTGTSQQILFLPASFSLKAEKSQVVSKPFNLSITAKNAQDVTARNYNSMVNLYPLAITPQDIPAAVLSPSAVSGVEFKDGNADAAMNYNLYGRIKIRAEDSNNAAKQGITDEINFLPKRASISVENPSGGRDFFYVGEPFEIILKVEDELGKPIPNYSGTAELESGFGLVVPSEYIFTDIDAGQHKFLLSSLKPGNYKVNAKIEKILKAESPQIKINDASIQVIDATSPIGSGEVVIQIVDELGNVITSENDLTINVTVVEDIVNNSVSLPSGPITFTEGKATIPVIDTESETVTIIPASSYKINVKKGTIVFGKAGKSGIGTLMWRELKGKR